MSDTTTRAKNLPSGLVPFTSETAAAAGRKSAEARRARRAQETGDPEAVSKYFAHVAGSYEPDAEMMADDAVVLVRHLIAQLASGKIEVRHAADAASLITALHNLARLERGESTSNVITANATDLTARIMAALEQRGSTSIVDVPSVDVEAEKG